MYRKNVIWIGITVVVAVLSCYYLHVTNGIYDGALLDNMIPFTVTVPVIACSLLWRILTGKTQEQSRPKPWQILLSTILLLAGVGLAIYLLRTRPTVSAVLFALYLAVLIPFAIWDTWRKKTPPRDPIRSWCLAMLGFYLSGAVVMFAYIQVVRPVTVAQAIQLVDEKYEEENYEFIGHIDGHKGYNPLGVYWFVQENGGQSDWLEVDILTGASQYV